MRNPENVLISLTKHSNQKDYKYERLYRLLYNEELYLTAYQNIYSNDGSMTKGTDKQTVDGMSIERIRKIIVSLKDESYQPKPARRTYIPKKNGKMRPLGIPSFEDKLLQEVIRMILEAIYEGHFENTSHGFRPNRSCHTALNEIQKTFTGVKWFIEGDIKGFFDNINHATLIGILRERINDERFLRLVRKFLNAGYIENWTFHNTYSGTPQGGLCRYPHKPPWTTPAPLGAALGCMDIKAGIMVVGLIILDMALYYPFVKLLDKQKLEEENSK